MTYLTEDVGFSAFFGAFYIAICVYCWASMLRWLQCFKRREISDSCGFNFVLGLFALLRGVEMALTLGDSNRFDDEVCFHG